MTVGGKQDTTLDLPVIMNQRNMQNLSAQELLKTPMSYNGEQSLSPQDIRLVSNPSVVQQNSHYNSIQMNPMFNSQSDSKAFLPMDRSGLPPAPKPPTGMVRAPFTDQSRELTGENTNERLDTRIHTEGARQVTLGNTVSMTGRPVVQVQPAPGMNLPPSDRYADSGVHRGYQSPQGLEGNTFSHQPVAQQTHGYGTVGGARDYLDQHSRREFKASLGTGEMASRLASANAQV